MATATNKISKSSEFPGFFIEQTAKRLKKSFGQTLLQHNAKITPDQWVVLDYLAKLPGASQFQIAQYLSKDAPTMTRMIDLMVEKKLVLKNNDPNDRRKFIINISANGKKKHKSLLPHVINFRQAKFAGLTDSDIDQLQTILKKINQQITL